METLTENFLSKHHTTSNTQGSGYNPSK